MTRTAPFSKAAIRNACIAGAFALAPAGFFGLAVVGAAANGTNTAAPAKIAAAAPKQAQQAPAKKQLTRAERAHCSAMADAYMGIRGEIQAMGLEPSLEKAADNDAYQAYLAESERMGCFG